MSDNRHILRPYFVSIYVYNIVCVCKKLKNLETKYITLITTINKIIHFNFVMLKIKFFKSSVLINNKKITQFFFNSRLWLNMVEVICWYCLRLN